MGKLKELKIGVVIPLTILFVIGLWTMDKAPTPFLFDVGIGICILAWCILGIDWLRMYNKYL